MWSRVSGTSRERSGDERVTLRSRIHAFDRRMFFSALAGSLFAGYEVFCCMLTVSTAPRQTKVKLSSVFDVEVLAKNAGAFSLGGGGRRALSTDLPTATMVTTLLLSIY